MEDQLKPSSWKKQSISSKLSANLNYFIGKLSRIQPILISLKLNQK